MTADVTPTKENGSPSWGPHGEPVLGSVFSWHEGSPRSLQRREHVLLQLPEGLPSSAPLPHSKPDRNKLSLVLWAVSTSKPLPVPHVSPSLSTESVGW